MQQYNHRRTIWILIMMLIIFAVIFFLALAGLESNTALFGIGIPANFENWFIIILCIGSIAKIVHELYIIRR